MNIVHVLPELEVGGVESHVLALSSSQVDSGHRVMVVSGGGRMVKQLDSRVIHRELPVQKKNPFTGVYCAVMLAFWAKRENWQILHAHSRVPAWIAWWSSSIASIPFVVTCHAMYSLNAGLTPYRHASAAICVSKSVQEHLKKRLPGKNVVINNGIKDTGMRWKSPETDGPVKFLFVGRLTKIKGIDFLLDVFMELRELDGWTLDIVGEGPLMGELERKVAEAGLENRVIFHGYREDVETFMARSSCCLVPSQSEGAGLVLMSALLTGVPVLASDIAAFREISKDLRLLNLNKSLWKEEIVKVISGERVQIAKNIEILTTLKMSQMVSSVYHFSLE